MDTMFFRKAAFHQKRAGEAGAALSVVLTMKPLNTGGICAVVNDRNRAVAVYAQCGKLLI